MASVAIELLIQLKDEASSALGAITGSLGGVGKAALTVAGGGLLAIGGGLTAAIGAGLNFNNSMEQVSAQLMAFTKDGAQTAAILDMIKTRAASTPFAFEDMATAATALLPASKAAGVGLEELIAQAEILAASNPAEGLEGAAFALKEATGGDFQSAIERFNLPRQYINQLKEEGVPNLEILSRAMGQLGLDADLVSGLAGTASGRWSTFLDTLTNVAAAVSAPIFDAFSSSLAGVQTVLDANTPAIMAFADALANQIGTAIQWLISTGLPMLVSGWASLQPALVAAGDALTVAGAMFAQLWTAVQPLIPSLQGALVPVLVGLAAVVGGGIVIALGSMVAAMVAAAAPIVALVAAVAALYAAWSSNFLGIQDIVAAVWATISPYLAQLVDWLSINIPIAIAAATQLWTGTLWPALQSVGALIVDTLIPAFMTIVDWLATNIPVAIEAAVTAFQYVATTTGTVWDGIVTTITTVGGAIATAIDVIVTIVTAAWNTIAFVTSSVWSAIADAIGPPLAAAGTAVSSAVATIQSAIETAWNAIVSATEPIWSTVQTTVETAINAVSSVVSSVVATVQSVVAGAWNTIDSETSGTWPQIQSIIEGVADAIQTAVETATAIVKTTITTAWAVIKSASENDFGAIPDIVKRAWEDVKSAFNNGVDEVKKIFAGLADDAISLGSDIISGIVSGVKSAGGALLDAMKDMASSALSAATSALRIGSPSKTFADEVGKWIPVGIGQGVTQSMPALNQNITRNLGTVVDNAKKVAGVNIAANQIGRPMAEGIGQGFNAGLPTTNKEIQSGLNGIVKSAKKTLEIGSPSKVMAQEIGAPIVDGIVMGLVQRSPKAVQAMLDLASSMFDVVAKGVEAFGKLTQLGNVPQSAILNFSDAIQRTLTEFSNRVGQWDKAAMSAASQFTYKAGQVVDFLAKGVDLLVGIASMAVPTQGAIRAFADALAMVMSEIVRVSTFELRLGLTAGVEFASGAGQIVEVIKKGVEALNALSDFVKPAPGVITQFVNVVYWLVSRFVAAGEGMSGQGLGAASAFASAAGQIFTVIGAGVDAILKLGEFVKPVPGAIQSFTNVVYWLVSRFVEAGLAIGGPALSAATNFAQSAKTVIDVIAAGVDGILKLAEFVRPAPGVVQQFTNTVYWLVTRFVEAAQAVGQRGVAAAAAFAEGAGKVLGILKNGVDGLNALRDFTTPAYDAMVAFANGVDAIVQLMSMVAEDVGQKAADAAAKFSESAGKVLAILKSGVDGLTALKDFTLPTYQAMVAFSNGVDAIVWLMYMVAEDVSQQAADAAAKFSEGAGKVLAILKNGVDGLTALHDFTLPGYAAMVAFANGVDAIVWLLYMVAEDVSQQAADAAAKFAEGAGKAIGILKSGVDGLSALKDFAAPAGANVSAFFLSLASLLEKMDSWSSSFDAKLFDTTAAFAAGVQKSVVGIGAAVDALGKLKEFAAPAGANVSAFFLSLAGLLEKMDSWSSMFDAKLFATTAAFASGVNTSIAPLKGAIESLAKFTDFVPPAEKGVSAFFSAIAALLGDMAVLAGKYSAEFFAGTVAFGQNVSRAVAVVKAAMADLGTLADVKGIASGVLSGFANGLAGLMSELERMVLPAAENIGANLVFGIAEGINAQLPYLIATLQNAAYTMVSTVQSTLGIASPSKVFEQIGQYAGEGMVGGMAAMQPAIAGAGAGLGMAAIDGAGGGVSSGGGGASGGGGTTSITFGPGAIVLSGVQGGITEKQLQVLADKIMEKIANDRGGR